MAKVLIFNNFLKEGRISILEPEESGIHTYTSIGPGCWQTDLYGKRKHIGLKDLIRKIVACIKVWTAWGRYDVLILDSAITGFFVSALSFLRKGRRKLVIASFNVPRRRVGFWKWLGRIMYRRVDHFIVHSRYDIELSAQLYGLPEDRFSFQPFVRDWPAEGQPDDKYLFEDKRPFVFSFGSNARDYETFFRAIEGTDLSGIAAGKDFAFDGLEVPANVRLFFNIPVPECDRLVRECLFTVFTFDGSEPSCGQISFVTSLMLGKPVICSDWMAVNDYISDGKNGLLVKMKDPDDLREKMTQLAHDKELYEGLSRGALAWAVENVDEASLHRKIDDFITELVS